MMNFQQYIRALKTGWWIVLGAALISVGVSMVYTYSLAPIYEASATLVANPSARISETGDLLYGLDTLSGRTALVSTYCQVIESQSTLASAASSYSLTRDLTEMYIGEDPIYDVECTVVPDSSVLRLRVEGPTPEIAEGLAASISAIGVEYVHSVQAAFELQVLDPAVAAPEPVAPNHLVDMLLGGLIGFFGGIAFVLARQTLTENLMERVDVRPLPSMFSPPLLSGPQRSKVLIVEDYVEMANMLEIQMQMDGYLTKVVSDGAMAVDVAKNWYPDIVLLDLQLPDMDGYEVTRHLRERRSTMDVPIVMLTGTGDSAHKRMGYEAGVDDYIIKPPDLHDVSLRVAALLRRHQVNTSNGSSEGN